MGATNPQGPLIKTGCTDVKEAKAAEHRLKARGQMGRGWVQGRNCVLGFADPRAKVTVPGRQSSVPVSVPRTQGWGLQPVSYTGLRLGSGGPVPG